MRYFIKSAINWIGERLRYLIMWPINLIRDLPVRVKRLVQTLGRLILGVLFFVPEFVDAIQFGEIKMWLRHKLGRIVAWLHHLLAQLFDLVGGPEIGQFFFHFFARTTPLTADEIGMMSEIIGPDAIRYANVRVAQGGLLNLIFKFNGNLGFATWHTINIPQTGRHTRKNRSLMAHELTHVYQYEQVGSRYLGEAIYMLIKTKRDCYDYGGANGLVIACASKQHYDEYNREQQAMIVQDYCRLKHEGADVTAYQPFIEELQAGIL